MAILADWWGFDRASPLPPESNCVNIVVMSFCLIKTTCKYKQFKHFCKNVDWLISKTAHTFQ
jgi:hypothetical protein